MTLKRLVILAFLFSLFSTVTNFVPLSVAFTVLVVLLPVVWVRWFESSVPKFYYFLLLIYVYFLASTLFYSPGVLLQPAFYRRDGNIFPTYLPIILLGLIPIWINTKAVVKYFVIWATVFSLVAYLILPAEAPHLHHFSFIAHNAAGGFLSIVLALCVGLYWERREKLFLFIALLDFFLLFETGSRGSLLAFAIAVVQILILKGQFTKIIVIGSTILMIVFLSIAYPIWLSADQPVDGFEPIGGVELDISRGSTLINRGFYLWPRALDNFLKSPVFGQGFGSYNDIPYHYENFGLATLSTSRNFINSDGHAHNSYLNILSETGLIGFSLIILFLYHLHRFIKTLPGGVGFGLRIAFWVVVWSSFTEHRLTTPAQMLPFNMLVGLALSNFLSARHRVNTRALQPVQPHNTSHRTVGISHEQ
jgi:O-antigen ligase